jgi:hypothetical protein
MDLIEFNDNPEQLELFHSPAVTDRVTPAGFTERGVGAARARVVNFGGSDSWLELVTIPGQMELGLNFGDMSDEGDLVDEKVLPDRRWWAFPVIVTVGTFVGWYAMEAFKSTM